MQKNKQHAQLNTEQAALNNRGDKRIQGIWQSHHAAANVARLRMTSNVWCDFGHSRESLKTMSG